VGKIALEPKIGVKEFIKKGILFTLLWTLHCKNPPVILSDWLFPNQFGC
jgi:hypothetical protein